MLKKQFYRSKKDRVFAGVCGGISEHFNIDVTIVRLITLVVILVSGWGMVLYIVIWLATPQSTKQVQIEKSNFTNIADDLEKKIKGFMNKYK